MKEKGRRNKSERERETVRGCKCHWLALSRAGPSIQRSLTKSKRPRKVIGAKMHSPECQLTNVPDTLTLRVKTMEKRRCNRKASA